MYVSERLLSFGVDSHEVLGVHIVPGCRRDLSSLLALEGAIKLLLDLFEAC